MVLVAVIGVMVYRLAVTTVMYSFASRFSDAIYSNTKLIISMSAALMNLVIIVILNMVRKCEKAKPRKMRMFCAQNSTNFCL